MKKFAILLMALCLAGWLIGPATASFGNANGLNPAEKAKENYYGYLIQKNAPIKIIDQPPNGVYSPDYYLAKRVNPQPYINQTLPEKRTTWFFFSPDKKQWRIDWDQERKPLKYIVVHVIDNLPTSELNAYYKNSSYKNRYQSKDPDPYVKGLPPHSGHFLNMKEVYVPFHWIIYPDGKLEKCLNTALVRTNEGLCPYSVAWSAGNWEVNCESFSLAFALNKGVDVPSAAQIRAANYVIKEVRKVVPDVIVAPHYQFNSQSNCAWGFESWKDKLL